MKEMNQRKDDSNKVVYNISIIMSSMLNLLRKEKTLWWLE